MNYFDNKSEKILPIKDDVSAYEERVKNRIQNSKIRSKYLKKIIKEIQMESGIRPNDII